MADFKKLFSQSSRLYTAGSPIIIEAGAIQENCETGKIFIQLKFSSVSDKPIHAVQLSIENFDSLGNDLGSVNAIYQDIVIGADGFFGSRTPIFLENTSARSFQINQITVLSESGEKWECSVNEGWISLKEQTAAEEYFTDLEMRKQYRLSCGEAAKWMPCTDRDLWFCSCGAIHRQGENQCNRCNRSEKDVFDFSLDQLSEKMNARLEEEAKVAEEKRIKREAAKVKAKKNAKKALKFSAVAAVILAVIFSGAMIIKNIVIPSVQYSNAVSKLDSCEYDAAIAAFEALGDYKDSSDKIKTAKLNKAMSILDSEDYTEAYKLLEEIGEKDIVVSSKYNRAMSLIDNAEYDAAYTLLKEIGKNDIIASSMFDRIIALIDCGDYNSAYDLLKNLENGESSSSNRYNSAMKYIDSGDYEAAYILLDGLSYKDSNDKFKSIKPKYHKILLSRANIGDVIYFGSYEQDNETSNGTEDIEWQVLDKKGNSILVISKYALDRQPYITPYDDNITWEKCSLRKWLNDTFLKSAFNSEEQIMIKSVTLSADKNPNYNTNPGNATKDKVFLLSTSECEKYLSTCASRACDATKYAVEHNTSHRLFFTSYESVNWWLRTPGALQGCASIIDLGGAIYYIGTVGGFNEYVRPAMWINID